MALACDILKVASISLSSFAVGAALVNVAYAILWRRRT